ncbi:bifunctional 4-hydroxy-2-oxoglutarate aldolase/2-dehydro-3-deoxy-phosphogluconate aldolase [Nevskia sp.]|uniref:bifunctional 4-hydroxy-2-oxoglutarate aldolase/2-dehydro-3-deoxy-phosphogluconate aldolase n=1 Tax=Nevskia sp. TaxID=1929292 RepID=UPI0025E4CB40|nr:bifunctional 4-hydroxy-2-oxoglutarate aldolase/2-dehydro-3-deoxy-phosphogluconate aldolase [Nevskia sp.]HET7796921.1 bifunctional 4-hydroxy-2-oxoglutarate aldolase/2-dehydro-3-deoxy-phosphogluconate aldolase [Nevskia sp.]
MQIVDILKAGPVMPVIVLNELRDAVPLARALIGGGIRVLEVTLRTPVALDSVRAIRAAVPEAIVGVGTVTTSEDLLAAITAGAQFGVSPAATPALLDAVRKSGLPFLPGTMTPSEVLAARDAGFRALKLFPAAPAGGIPLLKALGSVFSDVLFCPTGGIDAASAHGYLALPNVACVGGSWLAPPAMIAAGDWAGITDLARAAGRLR